MRTQYSNQTLALLGLLLLLVNCNREREVQPLKDYYRYRQSAEIKLALKSGSKPEVLLGIDKDSLQFLATAFDANDKLIPNAVYTYWVNGERLTGNSLLPSKEGEYNIVARLGDKESDPILIKAIDPKSLIKQLALTVKSGQVEEFLSDGTTTVTFGMEALGHDNKPVSFNYAPGLVLYLNDKPAGAAEFKAIQEGEYRFRIKGYEQESNEIVVGAHPKKYYVETVEVRATANGEDFIADEFSEITFQVDLLNKAGKRVGFPYQDDVQLFINNQRATDFTFKTRTPGTYTFEAKAYEKTSTPYILRALSLSEANIVTLPVVFHLLNVDIPQSRLQAQIDILNRTFRDRYNRTNAPKDPRHADNRLHFELAQTDPRGLPMAKPGLDYIDGGKKEYTFQEVKDKLGWDNYWNPTAYLNVYVANYRQERWAGLAYYPTVAQALPGMGTAAKGTRPYYLYAAFMQPYFADSDNTILTHEFGHMLGLPHTFNESNCNGDSDYCNDTPVYNRQSYTVSSGSKRVSCQGKEFTSYNYMDYYHHNDNSFTLDQQKRMRHVVSFGLWLPTPSNGHSQSTRKWAAPGYAERPDHVWDVKPVACQLPAVHAK